MRAFFFCLISIHAARQDLVALATANMYGSAQTH